MKGTVAVVTDKLLIITGIRPDQLSEMSAYLKEKGHEIQIIGVPAEYDIRDFRAAPPEVTEAARLVDKWLNDPEARSEPQSDPKA